MIKRIALVAALAFLLAVLVGACASPQPKEAPKEPPKAEAAKEAPKAEAKAPAGGEKYPSKAVEWIIPAGPGGGSDIFARKLASASEKTLGGSFFINNVPGAAGIIAIKKAMAAPPDGYTILVINRDNITADAMGGQEALHRKFFSFTRAQYCSSYLFAPQNSKFKSFADVVKFAKENPGKLKISGSGRGTNDDITVQYLAAEGLKAVFVPYNEPGERYPSILRGEADLLYEQAGDVKSFVESKQFVPVVSFSEKRTPDFPDVPSIAEFGIKVYLPMWRGVGIVKGAPADRVKALTDAFKVGVASDDFKKYNKETGNDGAPPVFGEEFDKFVEQEYVDTVEALKKIGYQKK